MISAFGKKLRMIRLERDMLLKDMADDLGVSTAYLSSVENGKRSIPNEWIPKIAAMYGVDNDELKELAFLSNTTASVELTSNMNANSLLYSFARKFKDLDEDDISKINEILRKSKK